MKIDVLTLCPQRVTRDDGAVLAEAIRAAWAAGDRPTVDFGGARIASISFLDEGIAVLGKDGGDPRNRLDIVGLTDPDRALLDQFVKVRLKG